jgi:hypothetical protein
VVYRTFTNGTPISLVVAKLGTNCTRFTPCETSGVMYSFGRESVVILTTATPQEPLGNFLANHAVGFDRRDGGRWR